MDRAYGAEAEAVRIRFRRWLGDHLPAGWTSGKREIPKHPAEEDRFLRRWAEDLARGGWAGMAWPAAYGGRDAPLLEQIVLEEELAHVEAPHFVNFVGTNLVGPTLIALGSESQKRTYLPRILSCEEVWCQGFSEPNAGSDLAALSLRAVPDGQDLVLTGQKTWTSFATIADRCFLLARTGIGARRHDGITALIVDMRQPGIEVRPIHQINGSRRFNEVFFSGVRAGRADIVGEIDRGWSVAMTMLQFERVALAAQVFALRNSLTRLVRTVERATRTSEAAAVRRRTVAEFVVRCRAVEALFYRHLSEQIHGVALGPRGSLVKLVVTELHKELAGVGVGLMGSTGALWDDEADPLVARWRDVWLTSIGYTLAGGTSEILRNLVAERILGLPRDLRD